MPPLDDAASPPTPPQEPTHRWVLRSTKVTLHAALLLAILVIGLAVVAVICGLLLPVVPVLGVGRLVKQVSSRH